MNRSTLVWAFWVFVMVVLPIIYVLFLDDPSACYPSEPGDCL